MNEGRFEEACPKLAESYRVDSAGGTLLNLALCYEKQGKTATAWVTFQDARAVARRDGNQKRVDFASRHIDALEVRLSYVTITAGEKAKVPGLEIRLDGRRLDAAVWGTEIPVDPGAHEVAASAPGYAGWTQTVTVVRDAERHRVSVPALQSVRASPAPPGVSAQPAPGRRDEAAAHARSAEAEPEAGPRSASLGYAIGAVGLAGIGAGAFFGWKAMAAWEDRNDGCDATGCDQTGLAAGDDADRYATFSNVGFGVGLVGLGVGTALILLDGDPEERSKTERSCVELRIEPSARSASGGVTLRGAW